MLDISVLHLGKEKEIYLYHIMTKYFTFQQ